MKLALAIIAKDEFDRIKNIINLYSDYFDEIAIAIDCQETLNKTKECFDLQKLKLFKYEWCDDFSHKRNWLAEKIESDYYFRLDTDDVIINPDNIPSLVKKMYSKNVDVIYAKYIYGKDEDGNCIAEHWRETIIKKSENCFWKKAIHENIFIEDQGKFNGAKDNTIKILHDIDPGHAEESFDRNFKILMNEFNNDKDNSDPRTIAYIGRMLMGKGAWKEAIPFLELLVSRSGWDDDKYFAYTELAFCHNSLNQYQSAMAACYEALSINNLFPDAYICLGEVFINQKRYKESLEWLKQAGSKTKPDTMYVVDPSRYDVRLTINLAIASFGSGLFEEALKFYNLAKRKSPSNEWVTSNENLFIDGFEQDQYIKKLLWMICYAKENDKSKCKNLIEATPKNLLTDERIQKLKREVTPGKKWSDNSVVIFCGNSWECWGDISVNAGLGGSEEAVVYLSRELVNLGLDVTVFNNCDELCGVHNGVTYKNFYEFNTKDKFNVVIGWRGNIFKGENINANRKLIWMHDVPQPDQFAEGEENTFDKIIVLSDFHKSLLPKHIPEDKIYISSNGINMVDFKESSLPRNPKRLIYASSYDRGIQHLLMRWKEVRKEEPEAELHLFYGWDTYNKMAEQGFRDWSFKDNMVKLMEQDGVFEHGRVSHKKLIKEFYRSGIWVYPCHFEEISCITAMKAQACGCVPLTTNYAALNETVKEGIKIDGNAKEVNVMDCYIKSLIALFKNEDSQYRIRKDVLKHKNKFGWDKVAKNWKEDIF